VIARDGDTVLEDELTSDEAGISSYVAKTKRPYFSNNVKRDPLLSTHYKNSDIAAELCLPVNIEGSVIATINIKSTDLGKTFGVEDINMLNDMIKQIEAPIQNMKLYLMAKNLNRELSQKIEESARQLQSQNELIKKDTNNELVGYSRCFRGVLEIVEKVANEDFSLLLEGDIGVGKRVIARRVHNTSRRSLSGKSIIVHCLSENKELLEKEIMGHGDQAGAFEKANNGTIILKDISALPSGLQQKILNVIRVGKVQRVGNTSHANVNVRIISTSRVPLKQEVEVNKFSSELYKSLSTIKIKVPSLEERTGDIRILVNHFLNNGRTEDEKKVLSSKTLETICGFNWAGNITELKSYMERVYILSTDKYIDVTDLPEREEMISVKNEVVATMEFSEKPLAIIEKEHIIATLDHVRGNKTKASRSLGITVKTLYNKLHNYGLIEAKA
jgi:Nif-specific regulatory protein